MELTEAEPLELPKLEKSKYVRPPIQEQNFIPLIYRRSSQSIFLLTSRAAWTGRSTRQPAWRPALRGGLFSTNYLFQQLFAESGILPRFCLIKQAHARVEGEETMTLSAIEVDHLKQATTIEGVLSAIVSRWSARSFADREVSYSDLTRVFEAARWSASSNNEQPWRFLVGKRGSETHNKISSTLTGFNREWAPAAPVLILGFASSTFSRNGSSNPYGLYDRARPPERFRCKPRRWV